ncbi:MAG: chorismate synthase [Deltaproteobacteria bacterium]|nr:chorismate synthase [Deltaproteobacteria bacterium]
MGSIWGRYFRVTTFGESHGPGLGVVVDGLPAGIKIDAGRIQQDLDRRRPGTSPFVSPRQEPDQVEILSGLAQGRSLGSPLALLVRNRDARPRDYDSISRLFRPGQADYTYFKKYGLPPQPGGGRASGRETVGRVAAGAVAKALLEPLGMTFRAYTLAVGGLKAGRVDLEFAEKDPLRFADPDLAPEAARLVEAAQAEGDSVGGLIELVIQGAPAGLGDPVFDKLDASLGGAVLSIGAVKGVEFGQGFDLAARRGSEANDQMSAQGFVSNRCGGILGGISTGQPIVIRLAVKPTSSIARSQKTVDLEGREQTIQVKGRHDPCLCPRIGPVAEAMAALVLADAYLEQRAHFGEDR